MGHCLDCNVQVVGHWFGGCQGAAPRSRQRLVRCRLVSPSVDSLTSLPQVVRCELHLVALKVIHLVVGTLCHQLLPGLFGWTALFTAQVLRESPLLSA